MAKCDLACELGDTESCAKLGFSQLARDRAHSASNTEGTLSAGIARLEKACSGGHNQACKTVADAYFTGDMAPRDFTKAGTLLRQACFGNSYESCVRHGRQLQQGRGVARNAKRAHELFRFACTNGNQDGCDESALDLLRGQGVELDVDSALLALREGCKAGRSRACYGLGLAHMNGDADEEQYEDELDETNLASSAQQALELFASACKLESADACGTLGVFYQTGTLVAQDKRKAATLLERACSLGQAFACMQRIDHLLVEPGAAAQRAATAELAKHCSIDLPEVCLYWSELYARGKLTPYAPKVVGQALKTACLSEDGASCAAYAQHVLRQQGLKAEAAHALKLVTKHCERRSNVACTLLGHWRTTGHRVDYDPEQGRSLLVEVCEEQGAESPQACSLLGRTLEYAVGTRSAAVAAQSHYLKACDEGYGRACVYAAEQVFFGHGLPLSYRRSVPVFEKHCANGDPQACAALGVAYYRGRGKRKDYARSRELFQKGCDTGHLDSCAYLGTMTRRGLAIEKNVDKGVAMVRLACEQGSAEGCYALGEVLRHGWGAEKDEETGVKWIKRACEAQSLQACKVLNTLG